MTALIFGSSPSLASASAIQMRQSKSESKSKDRAKGHSLFEAQHYSAAARIFEYLWHENHFPDDLHNAASARFAAGDFAHAASYYSIYLEGTAIDSRASIESQLQVAQDACHKVEIHVRTPYSSSEINTQFERVSTITRRPALTTKLREVHTNRLKRGVHLHHAEQLLDPGLWTLRIDGPDQTSYETTVEVRQGTQIVEVNLGIVASNVEKKTIGIVASGGAITILGGVIAGVGASRLKTLRQPDHIPSLHPLCVSEASQTRCSQKQELITTLPLTGVGFGLTGAGLGAVGSGLSQLIKRRKSRLAVQYTLLGLGLSSAVGGAIGVVSNRRKTNLLLDASDLTTEWQVSQNLQYLPAFEASSFFLGLGSGMLVGSALTLLLPSTTRTNEKYAHLTPSIGWARTGLTLQLAGAF
ncbi:MAG: hypothetical protein ACPG4T_09045 [Nannocystaceae bacterium]